MNIPPSFPANKRILYCVLNWGLGHASRSIEIIQNLIDNNNEVVMASDGHSGILLQQKFSSLSYIELPGYAVRYPTSSLFLNFLANAKNIFLASVREKKTIARHHQNKKYDLLISDNRPGCRIVGIDNFYITHQLNPYHSNTFPKYFFSKINQYYINKYKEVWIPDYSDHRLSGRLSQPTGVKTKIAFLGPLSAYQDSGEAKEQITVLLSGPEPQRTYLENKIYSIIANLDHIKFNFIRGTTTRNSILLEKPHIHFSNLCSLAEMNTILNQTKLLISRTGYSTIMDIDRVGIPQAILIPTPGQTEQEYLGILHQTRFNIASEKEVTNKLTEFFYKFEF